MSEGEVTGRLSIRELSDWKPSNGRPRAGRLNDREAK